MLRIDPALPTLRIEPALPMLSNESTLRMLYALKALAKLRRLRKLGTAGARCRLRPIAASVIATAGDVIRATPLATLPVLEE
jgi:hypothetical protein